MNAADLIERISSEGVALSLGTQGNIKALGQQEVIHRWLPVLRDRKPDIVHALNVSPTQKKTTPPWPFTFNWHLRELRKAHGKKLSDDILGALAFSRTQYDWMRAHLPPMTGYDEHELTRRMAQARSALIAEGVTSFPPLEFIEAQTKNSQTTKGKIHETR